MNLVSQRSFFGFAKIPQISLWSFVAFTLLFTSSVEASQLTSHKQCLLIFATDYKGSQWTVDNFTKDYLPLDFFTREMKQFFISQSLRKMRESDAIYLDIENSFLKYLNDLTNDKMLITSATNLHKKILSDAIIELIRGNSQIVTLAYSDFKSMRFKFQFLKSSPAEQLIFQGKLERLFEAVNAEYVVALERLNLNLLGTAHLWFRGGVGHSADEANIAARASREAKSKNHLLDFESAELQSTILKWQQTAEKVRADLRKALGRSRLFSEDGFLTADVIDMIRKSTTKHELIQRIKKKYRVELLDPHATMLKRYLENVDRFAPGIYVAERKIASLEPADFGGLSADFAGLGAQNLEATARALDGARDITEVLMRARQNEQKVTAEFIKMLEDFDRIMQFYFTVRIPSGDDFVGYSNKVLHFQQKLQIMDQVARLRNPSAQRIAFIASGVKKKENGVSHRGLLAAHGESIEKDLRKSLEGEIPAEILKDIVFGLDMLGSRAGEGEVQLLIGLAPQVSLTKNQLQRIKSRFYHIVLEFNAKEESSVSVKRYLPGNVLW